MANIPPIEDAYIDEIIKSEGFYDPSLTTTQGVKLRELIKLIRDRVEQGSAGNLQAVTDIGYITTNPINLQAYPGYLHPDGPDFSQIGLTFNTNFGDSSASAYISMINAERNGEGRITIEDRASYPEGDSIFTFSHEESSSIKYLTLYNPQSVEHNGLTGVFGGRVQGVSAINSKEFVTLDQLTAGCMDLTTSQTVTTGNKTFNTNTYINADLYNSNANGSISGFRGIDFPASSTDPYAGVASPFLRMGATPTSAGGGYGIRIRNSSSVGVFPSATTDLLFPMTSARSISFQDKTGTVALVSDVPTKLTVSFSINILNAPANYSIPFEFDFPGAVVGDVVYVSPVRGVNYNSSGLVYQAAIESANKVKLYYINQSANNIPLSTGFVDFKCIIIR